MDEPVDEEGQDTKSAELPQGTSTARDMSRWADSVWRPRVLHVPRMWKHRCGDGLVTSFLRP